MGGGAWWAAVHGVAKSQTWLSNFTFTFHFHALEKEMATHSSILAWRIPGMREPDGLPSMGSHRVGHDWSDLAAYIYIYIYIYIYLVRTYGIAQGTLLSTQWPIWEKNLKKSGYMYMYNWFTLLYSRNSHHIVINYIPIFFFKKQKREEIFAYSVNAKFKMMLGFALFQRSLESDVALFWWRNMP